MNFYDDLDRFHEKIALIKENREEVSYSKMLEDADKMASPILKRSLVFLVCRNCYESVCGYVGLLRKKAVPILVADNLDEDLFRKLLNTYRPAYIFLPSDKAHDGSVICTLGDYSLIKTDFSIDYKVNDDLALLLTTSGSTGSPKLVRQSYTNICSNANAIAQYLEISGTDRPITTLPMSYTYGLSIINSHLLCGAAIILTEKTMLSKEFWSLMKECEATTFGGVPYSYEILKKLRFERMNLPSIKTMTQAGGKLSRELAAEFAEICEQKEIKFVVMYGQTEATARMSYLPPEYAKSKAGSMGIAIPNGNFDLIDVSGAVIDAPDIVGELVYRGDNVSLGYAESRFDLARGDDNHGVLATGDMARRDSDGFYYIEGRKKRFLKLFGSRVNLDEVEGLLKKAGFDCACCGTDDHLEIFSTDRDSSAAIREYINQHTGINPGGYTVSIITEIPRNEAGKVLYSKLN